MKNVDTKYYQSPDGQNVKRILVNAYLHLIRDLIGRQRYRHVIQMGYGDGEVVKVLLPQVDAITVLEGDTALVKRAKQDFTSSQPVQVVQTLFEQFNPEKPLADLLLGNHILEHVDDPIQVLRQSLTWLKSGGEALFSAPNATSLHRRIGVRMGLLNSIYELNEQDQRVGHQRVYDAKTFRSDIEQSGYRITTFGGFNLKLVSQKQMKDWSGELLQAIYEVSLEMPAELCSNLYALCKK